MSEEFVALDVETANPDLASICQVGVVSFMDEMVTSSWQSLVNPEDYFDPFHVSIHGIDEGRVYDAPRFPEIAPRLADLTRQKLVASHMSFDRLAVTRVHQKYSLPHIDCTWLDTARVCRRAWPQFARKGYGLADVASWCGIEFQHHDAEEDARAAGLILLRAVSDTGLGLHKWIASVQQPIDPSRTRDGRTGSPEVRAGNPDGDLAGEVVVFTGALSMPRHEAADQAAWAGCDVRGSVNKRTTLVVVGDQDIRMLAGHEKSTKHRKAEELMAAGQPIRILGKRDFVALVADQQHA